MGLKYTGQYSQSLYMSRLISPALTLSSESCLTFTVIKRAPFTINMLSTNKDNLTLFEDSVVSVEDSIPSSMAINIDTLIGVTSVLVFIGQKASIGFQHYSVFMKDAVLQNESCMAHNIRKGKGLGIH